MAVRWYVAYPLSYRQVEELLHERGIRVDHTTVNRWVVESSPQFEDRVIPNRFVSVKLTTPFHRQI